jgi:hypothetical protein
MLRITDVGRETENSVVPYSASGRDKRQMNETNLDLMSPSVLDNYRRGLYYYLHTCALLSKQQDRKIFLKDVGVSLYPWECIILFLYFSHSSAVYEWVLQYFLSLHLKQVDRLYLDETLWAVASKVSDAVTPMMKLLQHSINECVEKKLIDNTAIIKIRSLPTCSHAYLTLWQKYIAGGYEKNGVLEYSSMSTDLVRINSNLLTESQVDGKTLLFLENGSHDTSNSVVASKKKSMNDIYKLDNNYHRGFTTYINFCKVECSKYGKTVQGMLPSVVLQLFNCISTSSEEYNFVFSKYREWHNNNADVMYLKDSIQQMMLMMLHAVSVRETLLDKFLDVCSKYEPTINETKASTLVARFRKLSSSSQFYMFVFRVFENGNAPNVKETLMNIWAMTSSKVPEHDLKWSDDE